MSTPSACHLHFGPSPDGRYGKLIDPNGHAWIICSECINSLWLERQALNQSEPEQAPWLTDEQIERIIAMLVERGLVKNED